MDFPGSSTRFSKPRGLSLDDYDFSLPAQSSPIQQTADVPTYPSAKTCYRCRLKNLEATEIEPCSRCQVFNETSFYEIRKEIGTSGLQFHVVLSGPTALLENQEDIPVTYLNKGQAYFISVADEAWPPIFSVTAFYRISVRICFDDEDQRRTTEAHWQKWKITCDRDEVGQRSRTPQAVEFVQGKTDSSSSGTSNVELEYALFDRFSVLWYPSEIDYKECSILIKLNFATTDFGRSRYAEHSAPVRLCVKTGLWLPGASRVDNYGQGDIAATEISYCKIKVFEDHGAEDRFAKDMARVQRSMELLERRIAIRDIGTTPRYGKRKRGDWEASSVRSQDDVDLPSTTAQSASSFLRTRGYDIEEARARSEDLRTKLAVLQATVESSQYFNTLKLRGDDLDDPDENPIVLKETEPHVAEKPGKALYRGRRGNQSPASVYSQGSRGGSPPRASSMGRNSGHITPDIIPFQAFHSGSDSDEASPHSPPRMALDHMSDMDTSSTTNNYRYIAIQSDEVRLLVIYPGKYDDQMHCGLKVMPLHRLEGSQLVYQALSYAWGSSTRLREIRLEDVHDCEEDPDGSISSESIADVGSRTFHIRPNLYAALRRLRSEAEELWFWIDAICIDQRDHAEKAHQLPRMLDIYCNAWSVCIWLGEPDRDLRPFDLIGTIVNLKLLDRIVEASAIDEQMMLSLIAFAKLLKKPWFRRRWVIQEVSSSTRASVQYGSHKVNWIDFADAVQLFILKLDRIRALYRTFGRFGDSTDAFSHIEAAGASAIVQATNDVLRKGDDGRIVARLCDIETLVMRFVHFEATDPRDTIFALWSLAGIRALARDHMPLLDRQLTISPSSYVRPCESIYIDFICHCIKEHGSLDIICRHWALPFSDPPKRGRRPSITRMRSWIGLTTNSPFGMHLGSGGRMNGDSLVGAPGRKLYNASDSNPPSCSIYTPSSSVFDRDTILQVAGCLISVISDMSPRIVDGIIPYDALRLLGWTDRSTVNEIPDRLWRTLVADRTSDGSRAPSWWRRASMTALSMASRDGDLNTQTLLQNKSLPQTVHEYLRRVQAMIWNRRIFALVPVEDSEIDAVLSLEMAGLGPPDVRPGDFLCILMGCSVPVILRKIPHTAQSVAFELIGECYIHGMMDGEALSASSPGNQSSVVDLNLV